MLDSQARALFLQSAHELGCTVRVDGISHNEIENAKPEHIAAGASVLLHTMLARAGLA